MPGGAVPRNPGVMTNLPLSFTDGLRREARSRNEKGENHQMIAAITQCPYCGRPFTDDDPSTRDHVFVEAAGGFAKVDAHRSCNSSIGDAIEGKLQNSNSILNLSRFVEGTAKAVKGVIKGTGAPVTYDFKTAEVRHTKPVERIEGPNGTTLMVQGSRRQVEQLLRQQGKSRKEVETLLATATTVRLADDVFEFEVSHPLPLADRLAAKIALGAGALMGGDPFTMSPLADGLRDVLWERSVPSERIQVEFLELTDDLFSKTWLQMGCPPAPALTPPERASQVVFASIGQSRERTAVLAHVAGNPIGMSGMLLDMPMPLSSGFPVLVRDQPGGAFIVKMHDELERAVLIHNAGLVAPTDAGTDPSAPRPDSAS